MAKSTKLILAEGLQLVDIGHRRAGTTELPTDIGHGRTIGDIGHHRSVLELSEPHVVRRVRAYRDASGQIHIELEE